VRKEYNRRSPALAGLLERRNEMWEGDTLEIIGR
jgi:hypothetical protein